MLTAQEFLAAFPLDPDHAPIVASQLVALADTVMGGAGVEVLAGRAPYRAWWQDVQALYVNLGDPYVDTVIYDVGARRLYVGTWGDLVEQHEDWLNTREPIGLEI